MEDQAAVISDASMRQAGLKKGIPRAVDVLLSFVALLGSLPLLILSAAIIKITSPGPALFRQGRIGLNGKPFTLIKLRTMEQHGDGPQVTARTDPRVTTIGRVLRKMKLDELPEFWNVLTGDMSLVGPRPEVPRYVDTRNRNWQIVLQTRPGLTDPVTVRLRNEEQLLAEVEGDVEQFYREVLQPLKLRGYVEYLQTRSWKQDLKIMFCTAIRVIRPDSMVDRSLLTTAVRSTTSRRA
jgi:lipopolysaccharide/colanic/teichoic acid biosynthesis glycosyltransferase